MFKKTLDWLVRGCWGVTNDAAEIRNIDLIVPICYGTKYEKLTNATRENLEVAIRYKRRFHDALLVFGNCPYIFPGAEKREELFKKEILARAGIRDFSSAGLINNTVEEAEVIRKAIGASPRRILLVTGEMHARSAQFIWKRVFPESRVLIHCIPHDYEYQPDHPINVQRNGWVWLFANIARHVLLLVFGLSIRHLHHRAT